MSPGPFTVFEDAVALRNNGQPFVMVTVTDLEGSAPCRPGFRMIVTGDGSTRGTVGGGALEKRATDDALRLLAGGTGTQTVVLDTGELGITPARVTLLFEPFQPADTVWVFGGGHVCQVLVPIVASLNFRVIVVDSRPEFARRELFAGAADVLCRDYTGAVDDIPDGAFVVITTHTHENDFGLLCDAARREPPFAYVGMIASAKKARRGHERLKQAGITPGPNVYTPIGLNLGGGGTAAEIALSIAAEIQAVRGGGTNVPHCREKVSFS
jgi:xanthine dehydrogenase accessory factor